MPIISGLVLISPTPSINYFTHTSNPNSLTVHFDTQIFNISVNPVTMFTWRLDHFHIPIKSFWEVRLWFRWWLSWWSLRKYYGLELEPNLYLEQVSPKPHQICYNRYTIITIGILFWNHCSGKQQHCRSTISRMVSL